MKAITGKLQKVSELPPIVVSQIGKKGPQGDQGPAGESGRDGEKGRDGKDAPQLEEILEALRGSEELLEAVVSKLLGGDMIERVANKVREKLPPMGISGGEGKFNVTDLPGYRKATSGQILAVGSNKKVGFYDFEDIDVAQYTRLVDTVGDTHKYIGEATPGTATSAASWRIKRVEFKAGDDIDILWAGGTASFDKIWDNRASLSYS